MTETDMYAAVFDTICTAIVNLFTTKSRKKRFNDKIISVAKANVGKFARIKSDSLACRDLTSNLKFRAHIDHIFLQGGDNCLILDVTFEKTEEFVIPQYKILTSIGEFYIWEYNIVIDN